MNSSSTILEYLWDLTQNNTREWYHANKERYQQANADFERLLGNLIVAISKFDSSVIHSIPKNLTFKLVRDTRFSFDKSPYNPTFRAHISSAGKAPIPCGYYLSIAPDNRSFLGGGLFASMFKDATAMVREYLAYHGEEFASIIHDKDFAERFAVKGETLKRVPSGYDENHPQAEYLKNKSWLLEYPVLDELIADTSGFIKQAAQVFRLMKPFNDYLNSALKDFYMPLR
jgi:uncharacterized protein (TIGR02453 family)